MERVAVIAGTPVDTKMGVGFLQRKNREAEESCNCKSEEAKDYEPIYLPLSEDCDEQLKFQYESYEEKKLVIDRLFDAEIAKGTRDFFIYCNSLAAAFDFDAYEIEKNSELLKQSDASEIRIYTPLQVYRSLGAKYKCIGVMAAHNLAAHAIEEAMMSTNPDIYVIGTGNMSVVRMIEDGEEPGAIVDICGLDSMIDYMEASGAETLLLGCTHFPYLKEALQELTGLPIIDPADLMYERLAERVR